jgi:hypothetical protein
MTGLDLDPREFYMTNDMALVTWLRLNRQSVQHIQWRGNNCHWAFRVNDVLLELVKEYMADKAMVNPKEFNRSFSDTKRELYDSKPTASQ